MASRLSTASMLARVSLPLPKLCLRTLKVSFSILHQARAQRVTLSQLTRSASVLLRTGRSVIQR